MGKKKVKNISIIDHDLEIEGSLSSSGKLIICGRVNGVIEAETVIISQGGEVVSPATRVSTITIGGHFQGELSVSGELIILPTGVCTGKVACRDLIVENGGILNAQISCKELNGHPQPTENQV